MSWFDALIGGGAALTGVGMQQAFSWRSEQHKHLREQRARVRQEQHAVLVDVVKTGRRVQRALVDIERGPDTEKAHEIFGREVDQLTEVVAAVRLLVTDRAILKEAKRFEAHAKSLERDYQRSDQGSLRLTPLIDAIRDFEGTAQSPE
ncbi:hypothetical protein [Blastococcus sp. TF02A-30]|uniref:hypothetical protein n=1 Tax=Blastococcus sp. TF02A-30 TaxID=2250580 RepID=UPI000DE9F8F9|nr:hypothetical protein [Blastococcus sp. TF02A-30]RBY91044.1 hypothetical protein DQ241_05035 [Blastococcus sp. TF02A-30]